MRGFSQIFPGFTCGQNDYNLRQLSLPLALPHCLIPIVAIACSMILALQSSVVTGARGTMKCNAVFCPFSTFLQRGSNTSVRRMIEKYTSTSFVRKKDRH